LKDSPGTTLFAGWFQKFRLSEIVLSVATHRFVLPDSALFGPRDIWSSEMGLQSEATWRAN
jgi:hypothetical protein